MTNLLAAAAVVLLCAGTVNAQQKPAKASTKSTTGAPTKNEVMRSNPSAENTHDGTGGVSVGLGTAPAGTGLTNGQNQAVSSGAKTGTTKVDARSSTRTSASTVKAKKKAPKSGKQQ